MIDVTFYTFEKHSNSTKQPDGGGTTYDCTLIQPCGVMSPQIQLAIGQDNPTGYNYAYIPEFSRYYFIRDWSWDRGIWTATMSVDVLASFKEDIGNSSQYVLRAAAESNGFITDTVYPGTAQFTKQVTSLSGMPFWKDLVNGEYVLGVVGAGPSGMAMGASTYYAMSPPAFSMFADQLFNDDAWIELEGEDPVMITVPVAEVSGDADSFRTTITEQPIPKKMSYLKTEFNPAQYITSCMWFPFVPAEGSAASEIKLGWWTIPAGVVSVSPTYEQSYTLTIPAHPQLARGYYLHMPPYSRYTLFFPPFGTIPLDGSYFVQDVTLTCTVRVDMISGQGILELSVPSAGVIFRTNAQIGVPVSVGQLASSGWVGAVTGLVSGLTGVAAGAATGDVAGAIQSGASGIGNVANSMLPQVSVRGANGSKAEYGTTPFLLSEFMQVVDNDPEHLGAPLCAIRQLSSLPGYQMISRPEIDSTCTAAENDQISDFLRGGYYYE